MKLFYKGKDGGPESTATGYWLIEWKPVFSVALIRFDGASREAYHTHAFGALSWLLRGKLTEMVLGGPTVTYRPSLWPIWTPRSRFHKVSSTGTSWALTVRGPWRRTWEEYLPDQQRHQSLTHGRKVIPT
jgi:hypothetical protein